MVINEFADFVEKWPGKFQGILKNLTQKCTNYYNNKPELRKK